VRKPGTVFSLGILVAVNILNFYDRHVPGALTEPIRKEFGLTDTQVGLLGSAFVWLYAIVGVPLGKVADVWSRKKLLAGGLVVWSALTAMGGLATSFFGLLASRLGVAVGEAVAAPTATSWIGDLFPPAQRSRALALFMLGVPIGGAMSYFFSGPTAQAWGWRVAMAVAAAPAIALVVALMMLNEPRRGATEHRSTEDASGASMWSVLRIPTLWWIILSGALLNFNMYAIGTFLPALLARIHHVSLSRSGLLTGVVYLVGGVSGGMLAGMLGDRIVHTRRNGRMLLAAGLAVTGVPFAFFGINVPAGYVWLAIAGLIVAYASLNTYYGLVYSAIQDVVAPAQRGATMALYFMFMYMCGASFGPLFTGMLSDRLAWRAAHAAGALQMTEAFKAVGLQQAMLVIPALSAALGLVLWAGSRTVVQDMERRDRAVAVAAR
jgi:predicted MFS family arabinose efflux permease